MCIKDLNYFIPIWSEVQPKVVVEETEKMTVKDCQVIDGKSEEISSSIAAKEQQNHVVMRPKKTAGVGQGARDNTSF